MGVFVRVSSSVGHVVVAPVCEEAQEIREVERQPHRRKRLGAVVSESDVVVADEWLVPEPCGGFSVVSSEQLLAVDFRPQFGHVSHGDAERVPRKGSHEGRCSHAAGVTDNLQESDPGLWGRVRLSERVELVDQEVVEIRHEGERKEISCSDREAAFEEVPQAFLFRDSHQGVQRRSVSFLQLLRVGSVSIVACLVTLGLLERSRKESRRRKWPTRRTWSAGFSSRSESRLSRMACRSLRCTICRCPNAVHSRRR